MARFISSHVTFSNPECPNHICHCRTKFGIVVTIAENGSEFIKVAGFHLGETRFVGEKNNIFSIKVEQIPPSQRAELLSKIHEALPIQIHDLPITFA